MTNARRAAAQRYARVAPAYRDHWAPVLASLAAPMIDAISQRHPTVILDLGCGTGAIARALAADGATRAVGVDATVEMLAQARGIDRIAADATQLPVRDARVDAAISTFVLQHVPRPGRVFDEAARVLVPGGALATVTWGKDNDEAGGPYEVMEQALDRAGAPPQPRLKTWHQLVDDPAKIRRYARAARLHTERAWVERRPHRWTIDTFIAWATASGATGRRYAMLDGPTQARLSADVRAELQELDPEQLLWRPEVVFLLAVREGTT